MGFAFKGIAMDARDEMRYGSLEEREHALRLDAADAREDAAYAAHTEHAPKKQFSYTFYAVADRDDLTKAKWYRTYSSNSRSGWVDDLSKAKIWTTWGRAKGKATQQGSSARLVEFVVTEVNVIDNSEHVKKAAEKRRLEDERRAAALKKMQLEQAQRDYDRAKSRLESLKGPRKHEEKHEDQCGCKSCMGM